jgi:quercetin dioxygenase-like cupin family protein
MNKRAAAIAALLAIAVPLATAGAETLSRATVFEGETTLAATAGTTPSAHVSVQSWGIVGQRGPGGPVQEIPLPGFYVAHLLSGDISATIDGQTTRHLPGDYWTVGAGKTMQVKGLGEFSMLETIVAAK